VILELPAAARRVSLRWRADDGVRDLVGHLVAANDQWYVVLPEDRPAVWVPRDRAEAVRQVPERTVLPSSTPADLERAVERSRPALRRARIGGWRLADDSVLALGDPGPAPDDALDAVDRFAGGRVAVRTLPGAPVAELTELAAARTSVRVVLTASSPSDPLGGVPLSRGWALDLAAEDAAALSVAEAAGFTEHHRALIMVRD